MEEVRVLHENPCAVEQPARIQPYSGPKPPVEHELILLDAKHRNPAVMFGNQNNTSRE